MRDVHRVIVLPAVPVFSKIAVTADPHATVTRAQRDTMSRRVTIS